jgi:hypothetical protein
MFGKKFNMIHLQNIVVGTPNVFGRKKIIVHKQLTILCNLCIVTDIFLMLNHGRKPVPEP